MQSEHGQSFNPVKSVSGKARCCIKKLAAVCCCATCSQIVYEMLRTFTMRRWLRRRRCSRGGHLRSGVWMRISRRLSHRRARPKSPSDQQSSPPTRATALGGVGPVHPRDAFPAAPPAGAGQLEAGVRAHTAPSDRALQPPVHGTCRGSRRRPPPQSGRLWPILHGQRHLRLGRCGHRHGLWPTRGANIHGCRCRHRRPRLRGPLRRAPRVCSPPAVASTTGSPATADFRFVV